MTLYGLVGAGGFGREVMPVAAEQLSRTLPAGSYQLVFVVEFGDTAPVNGVPVMTAEAFLAHAGERRFNIAFADSQARARVADTFLAAGAQPFALRAASAEVLAANTLGEGSILCAQSIITANARIGRFFHANLCSYVAHDCVIGDFVTLAPRVSVNGRVVIEDHAYLGTGAVIREGSADRPIVIGRGAVVGMGAVVTKSVAAGETVVGNPAAPLRQPG